MKLSLIEILKQNDFDEEQIPVNILRLVQNLQTGELVALHGVSADQMEQSISKHYHLNPRNRQEGAVISAALVYMEYIEPRDAFGDPEVYQDIMSMLRQ